MSGAGPLEFRTFTFGDLDTGLWGCGLAGAGGGSGAATAGVGIAGLLGTPATSPRAASMAVSIAGNDPAEPWFVSAEGMELTLSATTSSAAFPAGDLGFAQLCRIEGRVLTETGERQVECFGQRGTRSLGDAVKLESLRDVTAWFGLDDGVAVVSRRPKRASGHDRDAVAGVLFEHGSALLVDDPRLSTTYTEQGLPARASLELWLEAVADTTPAAASHHSDASPPDRYEAPPQQFPRRAAGERTGTSAQLSLSEIELHAELFRWHMRGLDGIGVYLLARPR